MAQRGERCPRLLNADVQAEIAGQVADGVHWLTACRNMGISREAAFRWRKKGRIERAPSPYRAFEIALRSALRTAARRKSAEAATLTRQRLAGLPGELREFLGDPEAIAAEVATIQALPQNGRTAIYLDRLHSLLATFTPCPVRDMITADDGDDDEQVLMPPDWRDMMDSTEILRALVVPSV